MACMASTWCWAWYMVFLLLLLQLLSFCCTSCDRWRSGDGQVRPFLYIFLYMAFCRSMVGGKGKIFVDWASRRAGDVVDGDGNGRLQASTVQIFAVGTFAVQIAALGARARTSDLFATLFLRTRVSVDRQYMDLPSIFPFLFCITCGLGVGAFSFSTYTSLIVECQVPPLLWT